MESKRITMLLATIFGWLGGYISLLWGVEGFSMSTIIFNGVGAILSIWLGFKITH